MNQLSTNKQIRLHKLIKDFVTKDKLEYTAPEIQKNINDFGVYVDTNLIYNRLEWVYPGQSVTFPDHWPQRDHGPFEEIKVVQEDKDYLVIYKPKGVVVEKGAGHVQHNLLNYLEEKYKQELHLVHRLDKMTQGLLLLAKNPESKEFFQDQFRNRTTQKKYLAVVDNIVDKVWTVTNWQMRDKFQPLRQKLFWDESLAMIYSSESRNAQSTIKPLAVSTESNQSLLEIVIKTGRMHQIRLQCEAMGFPLSKDPVYNKRTDDKIPESLERVDIDVKKLGKSEFETLTNNIFGDTEYCLLSNYLKLLLPDGKVLEIEYKPVEGVI